MKKLWGAVVEAVVEVEKPENELLVPPKPEKPENLADEDWLLVSKDRLLMQGRIRT